MQPTIYSNQGDEYQRLITLYWVVNMLHREDIEWVQAETISLPGFENKREEKVYVEDTVICYKNGLRKYIQAKKNQSIHRAWSLSDLHEEGILWAAKRQIEKDPTGTVLLYSRTEFGDLKMLVESVAMFDNQASFSNHASKTIINICNRLQNFLDITPNEAHHLLKHIKIGPCHDFNDWEQIIRDDLKRHFIEYKRVYDFLVVLVNKHGARLEIEAKFYKDKLLKRLEEEGFIRSPLLKESEILKKLAYISSIGRNMDTRIGGKEIERIEIKTILESIEKGKKSILVTDRAGSGKTWLLLQAAKAIEKESSFGLLFIKSDRFDNIGSEDDLMRRFGLDHRPELLVYRLSEFRKVVVILDSLDALSLARDQRGLKIFLNLMDRLLRVDRVTLIAACREFDLQFDPYLRTRTWDAIIKAPPPDFENDVKPILQSLGVETSSLSFDQKSVLTHLQTLKIYESIHEKLPLNLIKSSYHIIKFFFTEAVEKDSNLGQEAINSLIELSVNMVSHRTLTMSKVRFRCSDHKIRLLSSKGIVTIDHFRDTIQFAHQTMLDFLIVRGYIKKGLGLTNFLTDYPPLPFIRPAIRSFLFYLHAIDNRELSKQIKAVLNDQSHTYHIKRLITESILELLPVTDCELDLAKYLYSQHNDLFNRFLERVTSPEWFDALNRELFPLIMKLEVKNQTKSALIHTFSKWMNDRPEEIVGYWNFLLDRDDLSIRSIILSLHNFKRWETVGSRRIIEKTINQTNNLGWWCGKSVSNFIDATGEGDDLLWRYIKMNYRDDLDAHHIVHSSKKVLHCSENDFSRKGFLLERLKKSAWLLDTALDFISDLCSKTSHYRSMTGLDDFLLDETPWRFKHYKHDLYHHEPINVLLDHICEAMKFNSKEKPDWSFKTAEKFKATEFSVIAYFLIESYLFEPERYADSAYLFLSRPVVLFDSYLSDEICELLQAIIPYVSPVQQEEIQYTILKRWEPEEEAYWMTEWKYKLLCRIPLIFRLQVAHDFIERWKESFALWPQPPVISASGGFEHPPFPISSIECLSLDSTIGVCKAYNDDTGVGWHELSDHLSGGIGQVTSLFSECVSKNPAKYLVCMELFQKENISKKYTSALLYGLSNHIGYRFGNIMKPDNIKLTEPLVDKEILSKTVLGWFDKYPFLMDYEYDASRALCELSHIIEDNDTIRLIEYYKKIVNIHKSKMVKQKSDTEKISFESLNSIRGIIANGVVNLTRRLLKREEKIPVELNDLLIRFSNDPVDGAKRHIFEMLPFLEHKLPGQGWYFFEINIQNNHPALWPFTYRFLYYQYRESFELVLKALDRMRLSGGEDAAETWGIISALCMLDNFLNMEMFMSQLNAYNQNDAWEGTIEVFTVNINHYEVGSKCIDGFIMLMKSPNFPDTLYSEIDDIFKEIPVSKDDKTKNLIETFISLDFPKEKHSYINDFFDYVAKLSKIFPEWTLEIIEIYIEKQRKVDMEKQFLGTELKTIITQLLRWADIEDDEGTIRRVIYIQDYFLESGWYGMEDILSMAERE